MKNLKLVNMIMVMVMVVSVAIIMVGNMSFAASDFKDLEIEDTTSSSSSSSTVNNTTNTTKTNSTTNTTKTNNTVLTTNNTSNYNNSALPKTGVESSVSGVVLVIVLGISAVYAYNKIQYYKNI